MIGSPSSSLRGLAMAVAAIIAVMIWYAAIWRFGLPPIILPPPHECLSAMTEHRVDLAWATGVTAMASIIGLALAVIAALGLAALFALVPLLRVALFPYALAIQTMPIVAVAPLLVVWSGYTFRSVVIVVVMVCFFPLLNALVQGMMRVDPDHRDLFRIHHTDRWRMLVRLQLPSAMDDLVIAMKTASALAVIGAIVAEFFVGSGVRRPGLGYLMTAWQMQNRTDALMAALLVSALLGITLFVVVDRGSRTLLGRFLSSETARH